MRQATSDDELRVMVAGAHPDDADISGGGIAVKFQRAGARVRLVSICNGDKGHMRMDPRSLAERRYREAQRSKEILGVEAYDVLSLSDCEIEVNLENRKMMTRLIRTFQPHLIFTHRTCDYHVDHRAVSTLVMDTAYLLGVPLWCPEIPIPEVKPAIYFLRDAFTKPSSIQPDLIFAVDDVIDQVVDALCSHESQFFEWLAYDKGLLAEVPPPEDHAGRRAFIYRHWMDSRKGFDADRFRDRLIRKYGAEEGGAVKFAEVFECSEYGYQPGPEELDCLFPFD